MSLDHVQDNPEPTDAPTDAASELVSALQHALALGGRPVYRLGSAHTSVTYEIVDEDGAAVTLLLDRHPPAIVDGNEPAEVTIAFTRAQAVRFLRGEMILPNELLAGNVTARGPVRRYLRVDPILRGLFARAHEPGA
jgi:hypothetical protein